MSQTTYAEITAGISRDLGAFRSSHPRLMQGFGAMAAAASGPGVLGEKFKELIALALGVAAHCDGCIGFPARALVRRGASREEIAEALGVAVYMGGGPSLMYAANAMRAYAEFSASAADA